MYRPLLCSQTFGFIPLNPLPFPVKNLISLVFHLFVKQISVSVVNVPNIFHLLQVQIFLCLILREFRPRKEDDYKISCPGVFFFFIASEIVHLALFLTDI